MNGAARPKNVLVTGAAGFIASHLVTRLATAYPHYKVVGVDKMDYCSSIRNLDAVVNCANFKFIKGNVISIDLMRYLMHSEAIDTVVHAAADSHVENSFRNGLAFTDNNVVGTHALLESARECGVRRFVYISTDEVYGPSRRGDRARVENDALLPTNPYAATKAAAEAIARSYWSSFSVPVIITRGNNVYGPHQYPEKVIPKFIRNLLANEACCVHGDGSSSRNFMHVTDVVAAIDTVLHCGQDGQVYNIGTDDEITILQLARELARLTKPSRAVPDRPAELVTFVQDRRCNDACYHIDSSKLHLLGWRQQVR
uniref:NAD-dependent epimerase/dehydratase domain-containing protein n=1 Tax=Chrysotila carterae TaxID=13221 RepID=A0A6T0EFI4_CHRCT